ncbi:response regulator transcription factor [Mesorhizobium sp.]|uniref:LuxR C-terminal-related transcriptional regulator n=2 Tax=Mesorhizobium sp. TaxID=1871066 RepID=UPI00262A18D0|nr:response regulator transcription factor [Mesorhizobium sp.]
MMNEIRRTVLIADDDEFFRIALGTILKSELDFTEVIEAGSLDEAIERLSDRGNILLALFDLAMPGMESPASLEAVRDFHEQMRVAVVSSSTAKTNILAALAAGAHGYIPKGLGARELAAAIRLVLTGAIYVPPAIAGREPSSADIKVMRVEKEETKEVDRLATNSLTPRQREVLALLVEGLSNKEIARKLKLGEGTVKIHMAALFRSLRVRNRQAAAVAGARLLSGQG